jgi:hypothetical protein
MIQVVLPAHLRSLAGVKGDVQLEIAGEVTRRSILDALETRYPMLRGTIRDHVAGDRRPLVRFFACGEDVTHEPADDPLPQEIASGAEPFYIIGAIAGGGFFPVAVQVVVAQRIIGLVGAGISAFIAAVHRAGHAVAAFHRGTGLATADCIAGLHTIAIEVINALQRRAVLAAIARVADLETVANVVVSAHQGCARLALGRFHVANLIAVADIPVAQSASVRQPVKISRVETKEQLHLAGVPGSVSPMPVQTPEFCFQEEQEEISAMPSSSTSTQTVLSSITRLVMPQSPPPSEQATMSTFPHCPTPLPSVAVTSPQALASRLAKGPRPLALDVLQAAALAASGLSISRVQLAPS